MRGKKSRYLWITIVLPIVLSVAVLNCGCNAFANKDGTVGSPRVLSSAEAKRLLLKLPYRYRWRKVKLPEGASGALAGTAVGKHRAVLHFGISLGTEAEPVPIPEVRDAYDYSQGGGFVFTDDIITLDGIGKQIHTAAQWHEVNIMEVEMEEKLCKASTGEACPP
jgi:hypothetical protein